MKSCVLIVDDDAAIRDFLTMLLADEGYEVCTACHGAEALNIAWRQDVRLILLDMAMPVMDGPAFLAVYRPHHPQVPIIVISAQEIMLHELVSVAACLPKPFDVDELLGLVHTHLAVG
jgi:two-component system, OmpR family, response regulator MprA